MIDDSAVTDAGDTGKPDHKPTAVRLLLDKASVDEGWFSYWDSMMVFLRKGCSFWLLLSIKAVVRCRNMNNEMRQVETCGDKSHLDL